MERNRLSLQTLYVFCSGGHPSLHKPAKGGVGGVRPDNPAGRSVEGRFIQSAFTVPSHPPLNMKKGTFVSHLRRQPPQRVTSVFLPLFALGVGNQSVLYIESLGRTAQTHSRRIY